MTERILLDALFSDAPDLGEFRERFALLALGVTESLSAGVMTAGEAVRWFFHAENCLFVRRKLRDRIADDVMSRGTQLSDLFDAMPADEAHRELRRELETMRQLCLTLLERERIPA